MNNKLEARIARLEKLLNKRSLKTESSDFERARDYVDAIEKAANYLSNAVDIMDETGGIELPPDLDMRVNDSLETLEAALDYLR